MNAFERWSVWITSALTVVTGIVYAWMKYLVTSDDPFAVANHPLQPLVLKLHILVAPLLVFAIGVIAVRHVWKHYRARVAAGRRSGILTGLLVVPMIITGYLIQAVTHVTLLEVIIWTHIGTGVVYGVSTLVHGAVLKRDVPRGVSTAVAPSQKRSRARDPVSAEYPPSADS